MKPPSEASAKKGSGKKSIYGRCPGKDKVMARKPIFISPNTQNYRIEFFRNFRCPFYETCLEEAAVSNLLLDCGICPDRKLKRHQSAYMTFSHAELGEILAYDS
jgi:hypothetical protein